MPFAKMTLLQGVALGLATMAAASPLTSPNASHKAVKALKSGKGTWYGKSCGEEPCWQNGACAFVDYKLPATVEGSTCISEVVWENGYHCGGCVAINYGGKRKIAMVGFFFFPESWKKKKRKGELQD